VVPRGGIRAALPALAALGVLAVAGAFVEDAGSSWSALYLRGEIGVGAATAGLGFVALQGAMTVGRLTGDRVVDRFGQRRVARAGGALIAVGMGLALGLPSLGHHARRLRPRRARRRDPGARRLRRGRRAARTALRGRADAGQLAAADRLPAVPAAGGCRRGRGEPARRPAERRRGGAR
jgi:hypothetical protein